MADEPLTIRGINWRETFPFTNLFRAFRIAIHPSKIVLALVALLLLYIGGRVLDGVWPVSDRAVPGEAVLFEQYQHQAVPGQTFSDTRLSARANIEDVYAGILLQYHLAPDRTAAEKMAHDGEGLTKVKDIIVDGLKTTTEDAAKDRDAQLSDAGKLEGDARKSATQAANDAYDRTLRQAYDQANAQFSLAKAIRNEGLFRHFFEYESNQIATIVMDIRDWNWVSEEHFTTEMAVPQNPLAAEVVAAATASSTYGRPGVFQAIGRFFVIGPLWLLTQHTVYFVLYGIYFLVVWAIFGGAISRIAAVHVAHDEKMSIRAALKFSLSKFLSFLFAPIIPLLIMAVVGLIVTLAALIVGNIPFLGPIIIGLLFFLALAAGFIMTLVLLGLFGGFNLMYPTIAVEGSDSFDAISRSFSYLYARPWRLAFYTFVSLIYGAVTYLFVRLFITLMLILTHKFVGYGIFLHAPSTAPLWPTMWPSPAASPRLSYDVNFLSLNAGEDFGALMVSFWVFLVIAVLGAFVISFYFSANSIIYYLMRREVDATEMDDVYLEQVDDEFAEPAPATTAVAVETTTVVTPTPPADAAVPAPDVPPPT